MIYVTAKDQWDGKPICWHVLEERGKLRLLHAAELVAGLRKIK